MGEFLDASTNALSVISALLGGFILLFGFVSFVVKERLFLSEALVATVFGIIFGPVGANALNPFRLGNVQLTNQAFSEIVICIQIMAAAISLPKKFWIRRWKSMLILLGPVVIYKWLAGALIFYLALGRPFIESLVLSACCAPTDPILANSITSGRFADSHIPVSIRQLLAAESAANDGLVLPLWAISVYLLKYNDVSQAFAKWGYMIVAYEMILSVIFGFVMGLASRWGLYYSEREGWIDKKSFLSFEIALTFFVVGVSQMLHFSTFISIFVTGLVFSWDGWFTAETEEAHVQEVIDNLLNLTYFVYFGSSLPWAEFNTVALPAWRLILTGFCILIFRRLPIILLLYKYIPPLYTIYDSALVGWFGPVGVGGLWYMSAAAVLVPDNPIIVPAIMFVVFLSVIAFGITVPFVHMTILTITTMSRSRSMEVPQWPENTPVNTNMISPPTAVPLTRITSNLSNSGNRLASSQSEASHPQSILVSSSSHLQVVTKTLIDEDVGQNTDGDNEGLKAESMASSRLSVVFKIENEPRADD